MYMYTRSIHSDGRLKLEKVWSYLYILKDFIYIHYSLHVKQNLEAIYFDVGHVYILFLGIDTLL